ncbi:MAG TPA: hypothetical protein VGG61_02540 [Gemmataceae bacterium]|jgi:hypothetical protein
MAGVRRESGKQFWDRVEREGRRAQAETVRDRTLAEGHSERQIQAWLVEKFQPLDGSRTRAWPTPNSWEHGREARNRPDKQEQLERDVLWVHENRDQPPEKAPTYGARLLLETAHQDPGAFLKVYLRFLPSIVKREQDRIEARRRKEKEQKEAVRKRAQADRRAGYREAARLREEAQKQAAEEAARRQAEKQAQERLQIEQAGKPSANGRQGCVVTAADREVIK